MNNNPTTQGFEVTVQPVTELLREVIRHSQDYAKAVGEHLEVNETDFSAMEHLIANGPMTAGDLAKAVGISPGSATVMIDRLVNVGHVTREVNPSDRRGVLVKPNPASVAQAWQHISPLIFASENALSGLSADEKSVIQNYLTAMIRVYQSTE